MDVRLQPLLYPVQEPAYGFPARDADHRELAVPVPAAYVGESEKIERILPRRSVHVPRQTRPKRTPERGSWAGSLCAGERGRAMLRRQ